MLNAFALFLIKTTFWGGGTGPANGFDCWNDPVTCGVSLNSKTKMVDTDFVYRNARTFNTLLGFGYCRIATPFFVYAGETVELRSPNNEIIVKIEDTSAPYGEMKANHMKSSTVNLKRLHSTNKERFVLRAIVSRTNPGPGNKKKIYI